MNEKREKIYTPRTFIRTEPVPLEVGHMHNAALDRDYMMIDEVRFAITEKPIGPKPGYIPGLFGKRQKMREALEVQLLINYPRLGQTLTFEEPRIDITDVYGATLGVLSVPPKEKQYSGDHMLLTLPLKHYPLDMLFESHTAAQAILTHVMRQAYYGVYSLEPDGIINMSTLDDLRDSVGTRAIPPALSARWQSNLAVASILECLWDFMKTYDLGGKVSPATYSAQSEVGHLFMGHTRIPVTAMSFQLDGTRLSASMDLFVQQVSELLNDPDPHRPTRHVPLLLTDENGKPIGTIEMVNDCCLRFHTTPHTINRLYASVAFAQEDLLQLYQKFTTLFDQLPAFGEHQEFDAGTASYEHETSAFMDVFRPALRQFYQEHVVLSDAFRSAFRAEAQARGDTPPRG